MPGIDIRVIRSYLTDAATEGQLYIDGVSECYTLEDPVRPAKIAGQTAIPAGRYRIVLRDSPRFGPDTLMLCDVPGYTYILIHAGNRPTDTDGCILVGADRTTADDALIARSRDALRALRDKVVPRLKAGDDCWIDVVDQPLVDARSSARVSVAAADSPSREPSRS